MTRNRRLLLAAWICAVFSTPLVVTLADDFTARTVTAMRQLFTPPGIISYAGTKLTLNGATTANATATAGLITGTGFLNVIGTLPSSPGGSIAASQMVFTSAGSAANDQRGLLVDLAAGYTGSSFTLATESLNAAQSTGHIAPDSLGGNVGQYGTALAATAGDNTGLYGEGQGSSSRNIGVLGVGIGGSSPPVNIGGVFVGRPANSGTATAQTGLFAGLGSAMPTFVNAAAQFDNSGFAFPILVAQNGGVTVQTIDRYGRIVSGDTAPTAQATGGTCGNGAPSIAGSGTAFRYTVGTGAPTSCTATYATNWTNAPVCTANAQTTTAPINVTTTLNTVVLSAAALTPSEVLMVRCTGY